MADMELLRRTNAIVAAVFKAGGTAEDCVERLVAQVDSLTKKVVELEAIAPRKYKLSDGRVAIYRCPDDLVPE